MGAQEPYLGKLGIAKAIAEKHHLSMNRATEIVGDVVESMFQSLSMGIPVTFQNFGSFKPYENYGELMLAPAKNGEPVSLCRSREADPIMDVVFRISPRLLDAMNNEQARQTSRRYAKDNRMPRKLTRRTPSKTRKKGRKANG